ncbi:DUF6048 family protein [Solitalea lacus]|uniref:DUF6048 family protein n=1 Tax=Solitalea lacus TaxID=2911172 RepID=UPI001EDBF080|nr:DUF6048 family protein [Solitalea lacus]UKJ05858.1 DUF6048 family protein [Solitalea lacus]
MKHRLLLGFIFCISTCLFFEKTSIAQDAIKTRVPNNDTLTYKLPPSFSFGIDISYPIRYAFDNDIKAFEVVADYRLNNKWFLAGEVGYADATHINDYLSYQTKGPYLKLGGNLNIVKFEKPTNNSVFLGARAVFSNLSTDVNNYTINQPSWPAQSNGSFSVENTSVYSLEFLFGVRMELFKNFLMGYTVRGAFPIVNNKPEGFDNLYIPGLGFKRNFMFNFNYTLSYMLPLGKIQHNVPLPKKNRKK